MEEHNNDSARRLHKDFEAAETAEPAERLATILRVLDSGNFAVIRRIPEGLLPLTTEEQEALLAWAEIKLAMIENDDVSDRDFVYHLLVSCGISFDNIMTLLQASRTQSREILERLRSASGSADAQQAFQSYFIEVAQSLLAEERIPSRDRGRHMLMTTARSTEDWKGLAQRFGGAELTDLRQRVLQRFLEECRDPVALGMMADKVVGMCMRHLNTTEACGRQEAMYMHWVISCQKATGQTQELVRTAAFLRKKYERNLPRSVQYTLESIAPTTSRSTRAYSTSPALPGSVESALASGWTIKSDSGRQVVLVKDNKSVTLYRPKTK